MTTDGNQKLSKNTIKISTCVVIEIGLMCYCQYLMSPFFPCHKARIQIKIIKIKQKNKNKKHRKHKY